MQLPIYQVDAFTDRVFRGNPAAVCPLALRCALNGDRVSIGERAVLLP
jgi:predicted PhzF superfamily epimerase YddE/YHI9